MEIMSKTLVIVRHGKSTWDYGGVHDYDRPLKETGIFNTQAITQKIKELGIFPDLVVSSPAIRALHTAMITAGILGYALEKVVINPLLYGETLEEVLQMVKNTESQYNNLFIFGHNPIFTNLPNLFLKQPIDNLPTSGVGIFQFEVTAWKEISKKAVKSEKILTPKNL